MKISPRWSKVTVFKFVNEIIKLRLYFEFINFRECHWTCNFAGINFCERQKKSRNRKSLYPWMLIPIKLLNVVNVLLLQWWIANDDPNKCSVSDSIYEKFRSFDSIEDRWSNWLRVQEKYKTLIRSQNLSEYSNIFP